MAILVVMGVSGAGKTTIARMLANRLGWEFAEGDEFHPPGNIAKMAAGQPLTDADRLPWLAEIAGWIDGLIAAGRSGVISCSALRRSYRDQLRRPEVTFVYLTADRALLARRLAGRHGHYMPAALLDSQLAALERPGADERAVTVDVAADPSIVVDEVLTQLATLPGPLPR